MALQKPSSGNGESRVGSEGKADSASDAYWTQCPLLLEYLTSTAWGDGSERETATLTVFVEEGRWKACLNDRARHRSAFVAAKGLADLLVGLEEGLQEDDLDWRQKKARGR